LQIKFSALYVYFSGPSHDPLRSRRPAQVGVKEKYPLKSGYFTAIGWCIVKAVADRYRHAASTGEALSVVSTSVTLTDPEPPK